MSQFYEGWWWPCQWWDSAGEGAYWGWQGWQGWQGAAIALPAGAVHSFHDEWSSSSTCGPADGSPLEEGEGGGCGSSTSRVLDAGHVAFGWGRPFDAGRVGWLSEQVCLGSGYEREIKRETDSRRCPYCRRLLRYYGFLHDRCWHCPPPSIGSPSVRALAGSPNWFLHFRSVPMFWGIVRAFLEAPWPPESTIPYLQRQFKLLCQIPQEERKLKFCLTVSQKIWWRMLLGWARCKDDDATTDSSYEGSYDGRFPFRFNPNPMWALWGLTLSGKLREGQCSHLVRSIRQLHVFRRTQDVVLMVVIAFLGPWREWLERLG